jgi:hypothetical protein
MLMQALLSWARLAGVVALVAALFPFSAHGQSRYDQANIIPKNDAIYPILAECRSAMQKREEEGKQVRSTFRDWIKIDSPAAAKLFPNLRFASLVWDMHRHPEYKGEVSLALGLEMVVAVDTKTNRLAKELWVYDNHDEFGKLLADYKATLRDAAEAKLVWDASCDIYGKGSKMAAMKKIADSEWHLGITSYDQTTSVVDGFKTVVTRTHYMRVLVDPKTGQITSSGTKVDSSNERKVPAK